ncbi:hypothetical protein [Candidatus Halocynthiibacter alkanivorans]|jgi:hypothetical protein|uniref:hypothetical protein n=1 Tax=Candidatus Halocynthiibacter alkanivorans TaxID=2267619 RepID=UPI000DF1B5FA|nr:hypothetical protein [Candidatus Halocynthiibacter alkanivorans]
MFLIVFVIIAVFGGMYIYRRGNRLSRHCRWRQTTPGYYRCLSCGGAVVSGDLPRDCQLRSRHEAPDEST